MRLLVAWAFALIIVCSGLTSSYADKRVALVIGNSAYRGVPTLPNTRNDATDITASLERLGFTLKRVNDGTFDDMRRALLQFGRDTVGADMAVVFFAGHGMEIGGENWLIPVDAEMRSDRDAENEAIPLKSVMLQAANASSLGLVILDACRNNPFASKMQRSARLRAVDRGLTRVEPTDNVLVAYASKDGTTASDGNDRNSPFTAALLNNLETPGLEVTFLFRVVRDEVIAATNREQQPFLYGSLSKQAIYMKEPATPAAGALPLVPQASPADAGVQAWAAVKDTTSALVLEEFIRRYGHTIYGTLARSRLEELKSQVAAVAPPVLPASPCGTTPVSVSWSSRSAQPLSAAEECALKPKDVFKECEQCPDMVVVPDGSFTMGSPTSEAGRKDSEGPQHSVRIVKPFAVGKFHVTVDQFAAFVLETGYDASKCWTFEQGGKIREERSWRNPGFAQAGSHPAVCLNWLDTKAYVVWLAKKTGKDYRLLTEAEWEYAARAGTTTPFWWGASISTGQANYNGTYTYGGGSKGENRQRTVPVDSFQPNGFGLYQVHGNVWDWVEDCWHESYVGSPLDGSAWKSGDCSHRVLRGGSWFGVVNFLRAAHRGGGIPGERYYYNGFRLGRTL